MGSWHQKGTYAEQQNTNHTYYHITILPYCHPNHIQSHPNHPLCQQPSGATKHWQCHLWRPREIILVVFDMAYQKNINRKYKNDSGSWHELTWWADGFNEMVTHPDDLIDSLQIGAICLIGRDLAIPTFVNAKMPPRRCSSKEIPFSRHFVVSWDTRWHYTVTAPYTPHIHHTHHDSSPEIRLREALWQTYGITVSRRLVHQTEMLWRYMTLHRTGKRPHFIRCLT